MERLPARRELHIVAAKIKTITTIASRSHLQRPRPLHRRIMLHRRMEELCAANIHDLESLVGKEPCSICTRSQTLAAYIDRHVAEDVELIALAHASRIAAGIDHRKERLLAFAPANSPGVANLCRRRLATEIHRGGNQGLNLCWAEHASLLVSCLCAQGAEQRR